MITIADYKKLSKKGNKYGAVKKEYHGRVYHSTYEMEYAVNMDWLKERGIIIDWVPQVKIPIIVNGLFICWYIIDFRLEYPHKRFEYHEVKGAETSIWKLKWKLVKALYPDYDFVLIKKR
jgi:hypothetical protein